MIGRDDSADIVLADQTVCGWHATIRRERRAEVAHGVFVLRDLDSENGTYVNDTRVSSETILQDDDRIAIGETVLAFKQVLLGSGS